MYFVLVSKDMSDKLKAKRAEKKKAEKAAEKKEAKQEQMEKLREKSGAKVSEYDDDEDEEDYVILQADSIEDLIKKIDDYNFGLRADSVMTPYEQSIGQSIDFKG